MTRGDNLIFRNVNKEKDLLQVMSLVASYYSHLEFSLPKTDLDVRIIFNSPDFFDKASFVAELNSKIVGFCGTLLRENEEDVEGELVGLSTAFHPDDQMYHYVLRRLLDLSINALKEENIKRISTIATPLFTSHYRLLMDYGFRPVKAWYLMGVEKDDVRYPNNIAKDLQIVPLEEVPKDSGSKIDLVLSILNAAFFGELGGGWDQSELFLKFREPLFDPNDIFIGYFEDTPVGIIWVYIDQILSKIRRRGIGWVAFLGLREEFRGRRYGRTLLSHGLKHLFNKGAKKVLLWVNTENSVAVRLYRMFNFSVEKSAYLMWYYTR